MSRPRFALALVAVGLAAVIAAGSAVGGTPSGGKPGRADAVARAARLGAASPGDRLVVDAAVPAALTRVLADRLAREVPLPTGGSFAGVRWEVAGGAFSRPQVAAILQHNATCQWLRAWRDGREPGVPRRVLEAVASWPVWRGGEGARRLAAVLADVRAGGGDAAAGALRECDVSHTREVRYAAALGLKPSV